MTAFEQYSFIGITGVIGSGKSFFANSLKNTYDANIIELDHIRRHLLWSSYSSLAISLRKKLIHMFNIDKYDAFFFFNREQFTNIIFSNIDILNEFNKICFPYFKEEINNHFIENKLNVLIWANLIEDDYHTFLEHVILITVSQETWTLRNALYLTSMQTRLSLQSSEEYKIKLLNSLSISYEVFINE